MNGARVAVSGRVLLVTSSYVPTMIADMHRARHLAWELPQHGWEVDVLAPATEFQHPVYVEPESRPFFNPEISCTFVKPRDFWFFRGLGLRSMSWRALWPLYRAGAQLIRQGRYDLIYITTAKFNFFCLGRLWKWRFGVKYLLDFHDPWVREGPSIATSPSAIKRRLARWIAKPMESFSIHGASAIVSVSPVYVDQLRARYGAVAGLQPGRCEVIPFAAREDDLVAALSDDTDDLSADGGTIEIVYVGAGGVIMERSFEMICKCFRHLSDIDPRVIEGVRIRLYGTYAFWKPGEPKPMGDAIVRFGLENTVVEEPTRIGYTKAMELVRGADGVLVLGVDDAGYIPSKLFNYALSGKPLLACLRADSPARRFFEEMPGLGHCIVFGEGEAEFPERAIAEMRAFLLEACAGTTSKRKDLISRYLAPAMAKRHADLFARVCSSGTASTCPQRERLA